MVLNRRDLVKNLALAGSGMFFGGASAEEPIPGVREVLVAFKCHFDLGFTAPQESVLRRYFDQHFLRAIEVAEAMRQSGEDRYVWTTGSWLLYEYLEQADSEQRKRLEKAIAAGDVAWHALPFTWESELLDASMISGAIGLSRSLDRRFGRTTTGAKMTDVPGHTRSLIKPLVENGVTLLDVGVNSGSTPPEVPPVFLWKDPQNRSIVVLYHHTYGGIVQVPNSNLAIAMIVRRGDNSGPHKLEEIPKLYADLRRQFPNATIRATNLTGIAQAVERYRSQLPVVTQEIGDTWIYGVPSDPVKMARFRELSRLRREWIARRQFQSGDSTDLAFLRRLALTAEHTWGTDTKSRLDFNHYKPADLAQVINEPGYKIMVASWADKRANIDQGVASLPAALRSEAERRLAGLNPAEPSSAKLRPQPTGKALESAHYIISIDPETGAICRLRNKATRREWASPAHPLALFAYQTLSEADFERFIAFYIKTKAGWAKSDFGKPNIGKFGAVSRTWMPKLVRCLSGKEAGGFRLIAELSMPDDGSEHAGIAAWPRKMYLEVILPDAEPVVRVNFSCFGKPATRMPEAMWLTFQPDAPEARNWTLDKIGQPVSPFDVVTGGNRHMHGLETGLSYKDVRGKFVIETLDAPVVALGERSPLLYSNDQPQLTQGVHFSLFNNAWGTNYVQWFAGDLRFRFTLKS